MTTTRKSNKRNTAAKSNVSAAQTETVTFYPPVVVGNVSCDSCYYPPVEYQSVSHDDTIDAEYTCESDTDTRNTVTDGSYNWSNLLRNGVPTVTSICAIVPDIAQILCERNNTESVTFGLIRDVIVNEMHISNCYHKADIARKLGNIDIHTSTLNRIKKHWFHLIHVLKKPATFHLGTCSNWSEVIAIYPNEYKSNKMAAGRIIGNHLGVNNLKASFKSRKAHKAEPKAEPKAETKQDTYETAALKVAMEALKAEMEALKAKQAEPKKTVLRKKA